MPAEERAVCERLRQFRRHKGYSQEGFAAAVGMSVGLLSSYENAQSQLNYPAAWKMFGAFPDLNPEWLAGNPMKVMLAVPSVDYPPPEETGFGPRASFLEVFEGLLKDKILGSRAYWNVGKNDPWPYFRFSPTVTGRRFAVATFGEVLKRWLPHVPDDKLSDFLNKLAHFGEAQLRVLPPEQAEVIERRRRELASLELARLGHGGKAASGQAGQGGVSNILAGKGPCWPQLRQAVIDQMAQREMTQAALAKVLGVSRQIVSAWLKPAGPQPAAEATLRLLVWVQGPAVSGSPG